MSGCKDVSIQVLGIMLFVVMLILCLVVWCVVCTRVYVLCYVVVLCPVQPELPVESKKYYTNLLRAEMTALENG